MGIDYYLVNTNNKTFYYLGRGNWGDLSYEKDSLFDLEYLELFLKDDVELFDENNYCNKIANELYAFADGANKDQIFISSDCNDNMIYVYAHKYKCVGSRYSDDNWIELHNRHLKEPIYNRWYNDCDVNEVIISGKVYKL
jgi:hypothetical protein